MTVVKIQKRFGHGSAPARLTLPPDGVDPLPPLETWTDEFGMKPQENLPEEYATGLKMRNWYNYHDKPMPKFFPSAEEHGRLWQEMHVERIMDNHPGHEIHSSELPDYHYWPMIQNDVESKFTGQVPQLVQYQYHSDQQDIPRFHKNGVPKTPPQEQVWYTPLDDNGRCNWKAAIARWAGSEAQRQVFSVRGWNDRYYRRAYIDSIFSWRNGLKLLNVHRPIYYRHNEIDAYTRFWRLRRGTRVAQPLIFVVFWFAFVGTCGANFATYKALAWSDEPWNYDIFYMKYYRDHGNYHGAI